MNSFVFQVSELSGYIKNLMSGNPILSDVTLTGEISGSRGRHYSGHYYFDLKDDHAVINGVMFQSSAKNLTFEPKDGLQVIAKGRITIYEKSSRYQIIIESMEEAGQGHLAVAFQKLKEKLEEEGLFDQRHKKKLPLYPKKIAVLTSPTGAVLHDIKNVISRRYPQGEILLIPIPVQGKGAEKEIAKGLRLLDGLEGIDVAILARGGGSLEDLWCFNEEDVVRAIFALKVPIVTAIGHETDVSLADFTADVYAPTPSAAAELITPDYMALRSYHEEIKRQMQTTLHHRLQQEEQKLAILIEKGYFHKPHLFYETKEIFLDQLKADLLTEGEKNHLHHRHQLISLVKELEILSPLRTLSRGFTMVHKDGKTITSKDDVTKGDFITIDFKDGSKNAVIE